MTVIYFVRHAKVDHSVKEEAIRPLTEEGLKGAIKVKEVLKDKAIDVIYSSPYDRTLDTVSPLAKALKKEVHPISDLRERCIGRWVEDFDGFCKNQWDDFDYKLEKGESLNEVQARNIAVLKELLDKHKDQVLLVSTHGTALATIINYYDKSFLLEGFESIRHKMPLIMRFDFDGDKLLSRREISL